MPSGGWDVFLLETDWGTALNNRAKYRDKNDFNPNEHRDGRKAQYRRGFSRMLPEHLTGAVGPETGKEQGNREILSRIVET
jgi:hypothetical protein